MPPSDTPDSIKHDSVERCLLAITKDVRFVQQCTELLHRILGPSASRSALIVAEYLSSILYLIFTTKTTSLTQGRLQSSVSTPGMDACRMQFILEDSPEKVSLWPRLPLKLRNSSLTTAVLLSTTFLYAIRWLSEQILHDRDFPKNFNKFTGTQRRNVYHFQRQEMIRRGKAANGRIKPIQNVNLKHRTSKRYAQYHVWCDRILLQLCALGRAVVVSFDRALPFMVSDGPHAPAVSATSTNSEESASSDSDEIRRVFVWIFQFHMAFCCIYGGLPTLLRRFFPYRPQRVQLKKEEHQQGEQFSIIPLVGAAILGRLFYQFLFDAVSRRLVRYWASKRFHWWTQQRRRRTADNFMVAGEVHAPPQNGIELIGISPPPERTNCIACYICQQRPLYPSCLICCGHVFCWYCIQQWITDYDAKCPICRASCESQEVMHLYNG